MSMRDEQNEIFDWAKGEVEKLRIHKYQQHLLICMISRKLSHPLKETKEIITEIVEGADMERFQQIPERQEERKNKGFVKITPQHELKILEDELHGCENLPDEDLARGNIVSNVIQYYCKKTIEL